MKGRWWSDRKQHQDEAQIAEKAQNRRDVSFYAEIGDEEGYLALMQSLNPLITPDELQQKRELFRELCRIHAARAAQRRPF